MANLSTSEIAPKAKESFVLFYSSRCDECKKFNKLLQEYPDLNTCFKKIMFEQLQPQQIPPQLTHVPALIDGNQMIMGPDAFKWLSEKVKSYFSSSGTQLNSSGEHGIGFSFIGDAESDYDSKSAQWGVESKSNGTSIDPNKFDPRSGQPIQESNNQSIQQQDNPSKLPPELQPIKVNENNKMNTNNSESLMRKLEQERSLDFSNSQGGNNNNNNNMNNNRGMQMPMRM